MSHHRWLVSLAVASVMVVLAACADSTAPNGDCPVTTGPWSCNGH